MGYPGEICLVWYSSLLPGHKLEWPIFTTAHPVPGHERVNECDPYYRMRISPQIH